MSNFNCEHCGAPCLDSPNGYTTGCEHYPPDVKKVTHPIMRDFNGNPIEVSDSGKWMPKIKPLVWERGNELIDEWTAETPFGKFRVFRRPQDEVARIYLSPIQSIKHPHLEDVEETKAYCEAEYERCVMECLE